MPIGVLITKGSLNVALELWCRKHGIMSVFNFKANDVLRKLGEANGQPNPPPSR